MLGAALLLCRLLLRTRGFERSLRAARRWAASRSAAGIRIAPVRRDAHELGRHIAAAGRWPWVRAACLPQALLLGAMLAAEGRAAELVIGVTGSLQRFGAHAWVELDGCPIAQPESSLATFRELSRFCVLKTPGG